MKYQIKIHAFEGPFDLLFHLIEKNEVDIYDIPIAEITRQYLDYLQEMETLDMEIASEFLVLAATLLAIKAKMLLPKPTVEFTEENFAEEDPREELVLKLLEYKKYKLIAQFFQEQEIEQSKIFSRPNEEELFLALFPEKNPLAGVELDDLKNAFMRVLKKSVFAQERSIQEIPREEITIKMKINEITQVLKKTPQGVSFFKLFSDATNKVEIVVQFLALLELMRIQSVRVSQSYHHGDILIFPN